MAESVSSLCATDCYIELRNANYESCVDYSLPFPPPSIDASPAAGHRTFLCSICQQKQRESMDRLRSAAISVYLEHTLSAAIAVKGVIQQRKANKATNEAVELWINYCRNAESLCGVFGLVAVDRAEEHLMHCLAYERSLGSTETAKIGAAAVLTYRSARCYVRALLAQHRLDYTGANLWSYAGQVYYHLAGAGLGKGECDPLRARDDDEDPWHDELQSFKAQYCTPENMKHEEIASLVETVFQKYNAAAAYRTIFFLFERYEKALPPDNVTFWAKHYNYVNAELYASQDITQAMDYTQLALNRTSSTAEPLRVLWNHCASLMLVAAKEWNASNSELWPYRASDKIVKLAEAFADTGHRAAKVVETMQRLSADSDIHVPVLSLQMDELFAQIRRACQVDKPLPTLSAINDLAATLEVKLQALLRTVSPEEAAIVRYTAEAARVDGSLSKAHQLLKECWERAAEQMRLSLRASTVREQQLHRHRSALLEGLASGSLTTATAYHAKASRLPQTLVEVQWGGASDCLIEAVAPMLRRCCELKGEVEPKYANGELAAIEKSGILAKLADCAERMDAANSGDPTLHQLYSAEHGLRWEMWNQRLGCAHIKSTCHRSISTLVNLCKSVLAKCAHPQLLTHALPLPRPLTIASAVPTASSEPSLQSLSGHSPDEERAARVERLSYLCNTLTASLEYIRFIQNRRFQDVDHLFVHAYTALLAPVEASTFSSIEAWSSKFGPYPPRYYLQCFQSLPLALKAGDVTKGFCWIAAARFLSSCTTLGDVYDQAVQREIYHCLLQKAGATESTELLPQPEGQVNLTQEQGQMIADIVGMMMEVARQKYYHEEWLSGPEAYLIPKTIPSKHSKAAAQHSREALSLRKIIARTLRAGQDISGAIPLEDKGPEDNIDGSASEASGSDEGTEDGSAAEEEEEYSAISGAAEEEEEISEEASGAAEEGSEASVATEDGVEDGDAAEDEGESSETISVSVEGESSGKASSGADVGDCGGSGGDSGGGGEAREGLDGEVDNTAEEDGVRAAKKPRL